MPKAAPGLTPMEIFNQINTLLVDADAFLSPERAQQTVRKWVAKVAVAELTEYGQTAMAMNAANLAADLYLSQPSSSGSTAFDRLARSRRDADGALAAALTALCKAQFRLLLLAPGGDAGTLVARDMLSGETLRLLVGTIPRLEMETPVFCRVAALADGLFCVAGAVTALDSAALAVATGHPAAGKTNAAAGARWAEAVYRHVVQYGTLDIPGLTEPIAGMDGADGIEDTDPRLIDLTTAWAALEGGEPDAELLMRTRQNIEVSMILDAVAGAWFMRDLEDGRLSAALERMLLVQLDVVLRRERSFSGHLTLDGISQALDAAIAAGAAPADCRLVFVSLRKRLLARDPGAIADDPALERLVQVIQGLRAKTVDQGCTEQEALAAAAKVAELLDRYGLSLERLDFEAQPCEGIGIQTARRRFAPIDTCMNAIAAFFDCRVWAEQPKGEPMRYVFFGLRGDVTAAQYLYEMVERAFETETKAFRAGPLYARMEGERRTASNSFQVGFANGICEKLDGLRKARTAHLRSASGRDLVPVKAAIVEDELAKLGLSLRLRGGSVGSTVLRDAFAEGEAAGARFEVMQPIGQAA